MSTLLLFDFKVNLLDKNLSSWALVGGTSQAFLPLWLKKNKFKARKYQIIKDNLF
jgi:hypothetical protein